MTGYRGSEHGMWCGIEVANGEDAVVGVANTAWYLVVYTRGERGMIFSGMYELRTWHDI